MFDFTEIGGGAVGMVGFVEIGGGAAGTETNSIGNGAPDAFSCALSSAFWARSSATSLSFDMARFLIFCLQDIQPFAIFSLTDGPASHCL